jgi:hypothetical protein
MVYEVMRKYGIQGRAEVYLGGDRRDLFRYVITSPFLAPDVARELVRAAQKVRVPLAFEYVHRTAYAGPLPTYKN